MCIVFNTHMHLQGFQLKHILHESNLDSNQTERLMKVHDLNIQCALHAHVSIYVVAGYSSPPPHLLGPGSRWC